MFAGYKKDDYSGTMRTPPRSDFRMEVRYYLVDIGCYEVTHYANFTDSFVRGDANCDQVINIADPNVILAHLFASNSKHVYCAVALDVNSSEVIDVADAIYLLDYLFQFGNPPGPPFPLPGGDPNGYTLPCEMYPRPL